MNKKTIAIIIGFASLVTSYVFHNNEKILGSFSTTRGFSTLQNDAGGLVGGVVNGGTANSILFVDSNGLLAQNNSSLFWNDATTSLFAKNASISARFEVPGTASISSIFGTTDIVAGGNTASSSTLYSGEFLSTGTTSVNFGGSSTTKGTCLQMKNTVGAPVYVRIVGTTLTVTQVKCHQ